MGQREWTPAPAPQEATVGVRAPSQRLQVDYRRLGNYRRKHRESYLPRKPRWTCC